MFRSTKMALRPRTLLIMASTTTVLAALGLGALAFFGGQHNAVATNPGAAATIPMKRLKADQLTQGRLRHSEVLRLDKSGLHSDPKYGVVLDGWVDQKNKDGIAEVRLWWTDTSNGERAPFGEKVKGTIDVSYAAVRSDMWRVTIKRGGKRFDFEVENDGEGNLEAYGSVDTKNGRVDHCRAIRSDIVPKQLGKVVVGLKRIDVTCIDDDGNEHRGALAPRKK